MIAPIPSPFTYPSALSSRAEHIFLGEIMPILSAIVNELAFSRRLTPPATAISHSPFLTESAALCTAVRLDEQAVFTDSLGP